jgi:hypothetical protein
LRAPYDVLDASGDVVVSGTVGGDAVTMPAGDYRVRVGTKAPRAVTVVASEAVVVDLGG